MQHLVCRAICQVYGLIHKAKLSVAYEHARIRAPARARAGMYVTGTATTTIVRPLKVQNNDNYGNIDCRNTGRAENNVGKSLACTKVA